MRIAQILDLKAGGQNGCMYYLALHLLESSRRQPDDLMRSRSIFDAAM